MAGDFVGWGYGDDAAVVVEESSSTSETKSTVTNCKSRKTAETLHVHHSSPTRRNRSPSLLSRLKVLFHAGGEDVEDWELRKLSRYAPGSLDALCQCTNFTRKEIRAIYNGFKQDCPNGTVSKERFKDLYCGFFPLGDARTYSGHVFDTVDKAGEGSITFEQFLVAMSVISRGTFEEKITWVFNLYDINGDGYISPEEMLAIVTSIYEMLGRRAEPPIEEDTAQQHADRIFHKMDLNQDGLISFEEFQEVCKNDHEISKSMDIFGTALGI